MTKSIDPKCQKSQDLQKAFSYHFFAKASKSQASDNTTCNQSIQAFTYVPELIIILEREKNRMSPEDQSSVCDPLVTKQVPCPSEQGKDREIPLTGHRKTQQNS